MSDDAERLYKVIGWKNLMIPLENYMGTRICLMLGHILGNHWLGVTEFVSFKSVADVTSVCTQECGRYDLLVELYKARYSGFQSVRVLILVKLT